MKEKTSSFEPTQEKDVKFKKSNQVIFFILLIVVILVALAAYYLRNLNAPRYIFDKKINEIIMSDEKVNTNYNTIKVNTNLEMAVNSDEAGTEEIVDLLNDAKMSFNVEFDKSTQEELVGVKILKANEELLDANMKLDGETQNLYLNLGELFSKTIQADMSEISDETFEMADTSVMTFGQKISDQKAKTILQKEIKSELKEEYFSSEKVTIDDENVTKNTLRISGEELVNTIKNVCENLSNNQSFIDCFEDKEMVKEDLQEFIDELEELDIEDDIYFRIDVYTIGFMKNVKRVDISAEEDGDEVTIQLTKINDEEYDYQLLENDGESIRGNIKFKEENDAFTFEMTAREDDIEVVVKSTGNVVYDEELSNFDTSDAVPYEELTIEDIYEIIGNFSSSKLYQIMNEFSGTSSMIGY